MARTSKKAPSARQRATRAGSVAGVGGVAKRPVSGPGAAASRRASVAASSVVAPSVSLAKVVGPAAAGWRVRMGGRPRIVAADASVDPALLEDAAKSGATVVIDENAEGGGAAIVGVLATSRAVTIDKNGVVDARVKRFRITADEEALLRTMTAFVRLKGDDAEVYGNEVVTRARELCRIFGRMIKLN